MRAYFNNLNEREKWMLLSAAVCLFIYGYYLLLYAPLSNEVAQKSAQLHEKIETLEWMRKVKLQNRATAIKKSVNNSQLLTLLASQLKNHTTLKFPYQLQQTATGEIQLTFEAVPFKLFMSWLASLYQQYAILIKQLDVEPTQTPGVTKLMILISAKA